MNKPLVLVGIGQALAVGVAVWGQLSAATTGTEVRLVTAPVDPMDPFRGAYVQVGYETLDALHPDDSGSSQVYVSLRRDGDVWTATSVANDRPTSGTYLACENNYGRLDCGIDSWFVSERTASQFEPGKKFVAVIKVDRWGHTHLVEVRER